MSSPTTPIQLRMPDGWIEVDQRVPDLLETLTAAKRAGWQPDLDPAMLPALAGLAVPVVAEVLRLTASPDLIMLGLFADAVPVEGQDLPLALAASLTLAVSPDQSSLEAVTAEAPAGWIAQSVDLPSGSAVLLTGQTTIGAPEWDGPVPAFVRRYFVAIPDQDRLAVLSFLTPNLELAEAFAEVFAVIATTVRFGDRPRSPGNARAFPGDHCT